MSCARQASPPSRILQRRSIDRAFGPHAGAGVRMLFICSCAGIAAPIPRPRSMSGLPSMPDALTKRGVPFAG